MATAGMLRSNKYRLYRDVSGTLTAIGAAKDQSLTFSAEKIDVTTKDTVEGQSEYIDGVKNSDFSGTGIAKGDNTDNVREMYTDWKAGNEINLVFSDVTSGNPQFAGAARIFDMEINSSGPAGVVEYSFSGSFNGDVTMSDVA